MIARAIRVIICLIFGHVTNKLINGHSWDVAIDRLWFQSTAIALLVIVNHIETRPKN